MLRRNEQGFAKINLGLRVLGRRPDGYHNIQTVFQSVDLSDDVEVEFRPAKRRTISLHCDQPDLNNRSNLAWRAAERLLTRLGVNARVHITLSKRIPVGTGLGGGSSDAGAVLRAISKLVAEPPPSRTLFDVASAIGSDVPYFLVGGAVTASGRGTDLSPIPELPPAWTVIALPDVSVSTVWAYQALADSRVTGLTQFPPWTRIENADLESLTFEAQGAKGLSERIHNDFESVVFQRYPALETIKRQLLANGARGASLSGSGSAVFGIFCSFHNASQAADSLSSEGARTEVARFLTRSDCGLALEMDKGPRETDGVGD